MNWDFTKETDFQDKVTKLICFTCKLASALVSDQALQQRLDASSSALHRARQVFRLLKSLNEIQRIREVLTDKRHSRFERSILVFSRVSYLIYWAFDNLELLAFFRVIKVNKVLFARPAAMMWYFGLVLNLFYFSKVLIKSYDDEALVKENLIGVGTQYAALEKLDFYTNRRYWLLSHFLRSIGDIISASNDARIPYKFLGKQLSKKWVGLGGVLSAVSQIVQLSMEMETFK
jgi:hypothetical protein